MDMKKALVKASTQKFTIQDKKMVIDAIKVRYNGILQAIGAARNKAANENGIPEFPIRIYNLGKYKAILSVAQRKKLDSTIAALENFKKSHEQAVEARDRVCNALHDKACELSEKLTAERDELIFQVSLLGSSAVANDIIANLRDPEAIAKQLSKDGLEVTAEALSITGIGFPSPKQISDGQES